MGPFAMLIFRKPSHQSSKTTQSEKTSQQGLWIGYIGGVARLLGSGLQRDPRRFYLSCTLRRVRRSISETTDRVKHYTRRLVGGKRLP